LDISYYKRYEAARKRMEVRKLTWVLWGVRTQKLLAECALKEIPYFCGIPLLLKVNDNRALSCKISQEPFSTSIQHIEYFRKCAQYARNLLPEHLTEVADFGFYWTLRHGTKIPPAFSKAEAAVVTIIDIIELSRYNLVKE
jgi:hypothetical protein